MPFTLTSNQVIHDITCIVSQERKFKFKFSSNSLDLLIIYNDLMISEKIIAITTKKGN